jgi:hypothetical protein
MCRRRVVRALVFAVAGGFALFVLQSVASLTIAPWTFSHLGMTTAARHVDDPLMMIPFAVVAVAAACGVFWDSYHRGSRSDE